MKELVKKHIEYGSEIDFPPPIPIGDELRELLREWLFYAADALHHKLSALRFLRWVIGGRSSEVLDWLDVSNCHDDYLIAKVIRLIGAKDRTSWGGIASYEYGYFGWLGKELGNKTWTLRDGWFNHNGEARANYIKRYGIQNIQNQVPSQSQLAAQLIAELPSCHDSHPIKTDENCSQSQVPKEWVDQIAIEAWEQMRGEVMSLEKMSDLGLTTITEKTEKK